MARCKNRSVERGLGGKRRVVQVNQIDPRPSCQVRERGPGIDDLLRTGRQPLGRKAEFGDTKPGSVRRLSLGGIQSRPEDRDVYPPSTPHTFAAQIENVSPDSPDCVGGHQDSRIVLGHE